MAKHYAKIKVWEEDRALAKAQASLKGMTLAEYFAEQVRKNAKESKDHLQTVHEEFEEKMRNDRRRARGFF